MYRIEKEILLRFFFGSSPFDRRLVSETFLTQLKGGLFCIIHSIFIRKALARPFHYQSKRRDHIIISVG